ncbi:MAG: hypothetical protein ACSHWW_03245 [Nonlabens sp.]|uniref:hypothetical protein n=1 Tax=Nonlabens sp. TaxID=1888209 RepID=UPI003EF86F29
MKSYQIKVPEEMVALVEQLLRKLNIPFALNENEITEIELSDDIKEMLEQRLSEPESSYYSVDEMLKRQDERYKV